MQILIFEINNRQYALDAQYLQTILKMQQINPVPLSAKPILGIISFQGDIITIIHPGIIIDSKKNKPHPENVIVLLKLIFGEEETTVGMYCDKIIDIVEVERFEPTPIDDKKLKELVQSTVIINNSNIWLLDIQKMLSPEYINSV